MSFHKPSVNLTSRINAIKEHPNFHDRFSLALLHVLCFLAFCTSFTITDPDFSGMRLFAIKGIV